MELPLSSSGGPATEAPPTERGAPANALPPECRRATKPHVAAYIALSRQRHKVVFKLLTTDARYDKEKLIASHLERLEAERDAAA
jgi:hypothetical protein